MIYVCTEFRVDRWNVLEMALFKGRGQGILPRPLTKLISCVQATHMNQRIKLHANANLYKKVNVKNVAFPKRCNIAWPTCFALTHQIWMRYSQQAVSSTSKSKKWHFLLPAGGAMTSANYCHADVFRAGPLWNIVSLVPIRPCIPKLEPFPVLWRIIKIHRHIKSDPFNVSKKF